ncbi:MAG: Response regulator MprA [Opitutia bacterium UBA7350]|nr:MAG: Response regulator MprA [Opitutae bacterium UBA7350]
MTTEQIQSIVIVFKENAESMTLADHLRQNNLNTLICNEADHALGFVMAKRASIIVIDDMLPKEDRMRLIGALAEHKDNTPVILVTSEHSDAGHNGITNICKKPTDYNELVSLIKSTLSSVKSRKIATRRKRAPLMIEAFRFCGGEIDPGRMEVTFPLGHVEKIGRKELGIIAYLRDNPDTVITRETLIKAIWGEDANTESRSLDQYIVKVRNLYKRHGLELIPFRTVHSIGYIYDTN